MSITRPAFGRRGLARPVDNEGLGVGLAAAPADRSAHGADDVSALAKAAQGRLQILGEPPNAGGDLLGEVHARQGSQPALAQGRRLIGADLAGVWSHVDGARRGHVGDEAAVDIREALGGDLGLALVGDLLLGL